MSTRNSGSQRIDDLMNNCITLMRNYQAMLGLYEHIKANEVLCLSPNYDIICNALIKKGRTVHEALMKEQFELFSMIEMDTFVSK